MVQTKILEVKPDFLIVNEIFFSIQGESTHSGKLCVFIRLTYCNLRCTYCDTVYAFEEGTEISIDDIIEKVKSYNCKLVEITGGEPLLQSNVKNLLTKLCDEDFDVLLETGGSISIKDVDARVKNILDFKCPGSRMEKNNYWENVSYLKKEDEIKFVICDRNDYEWTKEKIRVYGLPDKCTVLMSPVYGALDPRTLAEWILEDKLKVRFQLQLHKYIWAPDTRGI